METMPNGEIHMKAGTLTYIYYADHAERYKHLPEFVRVEYPDEVMDTFSKERIKRVKNYDEITFEDTKHHYGGGLCIEYLLAKDVPIRLAYPRIG